MTSYGIIWYDIVWHGMVRHDTPWQSIALQGMTWHGMVWHGMAWLWHGMTCFGMGYKLAEASLPGSFEGHRPLAALNRRLPGNEQVVGRQVVSIKY